MILVTFAPERDQDHLLRREGFRDAWCRYRYVPHRLRGTADHGIVRPRGSGPGQADLDPRVGGRCLRARIGPPTGTELGAAAPNQRTRDRATRSSSVRTFGTTKTPEQAVKTLRNWAQQSVIGYWGQCLRLADDAYMPSGPRTATAWDQWHRARKAGLAHPDDEVVPIGAHMFWDTKNSAGHIATHVGGGKVVTNTPSGAVEIMNWKELNEWGPYVGWAAPYYK